MPGLLFSKNSSPTFVRGGRNHGFSTALDRWYADQMAYQDYQLFVGSGRAFNHLVSIGGFCAVAYNLRRFHNFQAGYPFDWWVTPYSALTQILTNLDVGYIYNPELLSRAANNDTVQHECGIRLHHEFPRLHGTWGPVVENFGDYIEKPKARTAYLIDKLRAIGADPSNRILFVRSDGPGLTDDVRVALDRLIPQATWSLLRIPGSIPPTDKSWKGDPDQWDVILTELAIPFDRTGHSDFAFKSMDHEAEEVVSGA